MMVGIINFQSNCGCKNAIPFSGLLCEEVRAVNAEKSIPPEVTAPGVSEKDLEQLGRLAADKFAAAFKSVVSADTVSDHDGDDL